MWYLFLTVKLTCPPKPCERASRKPLKEIRYQLKEEMGFQVTLDFCLFGELGLPSVLWGLLPDVEAEGTPEVYTEAFLGSGNWAQGHCLQNFLWKGPQLSSCRSQASKAEPWGSIKGAAHYCVLAYKKGMFFSLFSLFPSSNTPKDPKAVRVQLPAKI